MTCCSEERAATPSSAARTRMSSRVGRGSTASTEAQARTGSSSSRGPAPLAGPGRAAQQAAADEEEHDQEAEEGESRVEPECCLDAVGERGYMRREDRRREPEADRAA